jgi:carbon-monoxide dehydrogenase medium subunit
MDIAVVGAAARVTLDDEGRCRSARVVLGAVAPTTIDVEGVGDALIDRAIDEGALEAVARLSSEQANPIDDKRGTVDYRRHVAGVLTKRALRIAAERAGLNQ